MTDDNVLGVYAVPVTYWVTQITYDVNEAEQATLRMTPQEIVNSYGHTADVGEAVWMKWVDSKENSMNTYAVQQHKTSGETFVLEYGEVNTITGICGPLTTEETEQAIRDIEYAASFEYALIYSNGLDADGLTEWHPPLAVYDPAND